MTLRILVVILRWINFWVPAMEKFVMERFMIDSVTKTSLFVSVNLAAYVIFSIIWGSISDKIGKRKVFIVLGFLGNAILMFSLTLAPTMDILLIQRFIEGSFTIMAGTWQCAGRSSWRGNRFPLMLAMKYNMGPGEIGMYIAAFLIPFAFLQYPLGAISDRIGRTIPLMVGSILYSIAVASVGYAEPQMLAFVMVIGGIVGALMYSPSAALAGDFAHPSRRGTAMGGFNMFGSLGFAIGPFIGGMIADMYGFHVSFAVAGSAVLVISIIFLPFLLKIRKIYGEHQSRQ